MEQQINEMQVRLPAISVNEAVARSVLSAFVASLDPTVEELGDLRCALSEAVTNAIVHAYRGGAGYIDLTFSASEDRVVTVEIRDSGCGIANLALARTPKYTTGAGEERCGMGFLVMESFTDEMEVESTVGEGTVVRMKKKLHP